MPHLRFLPVQAGLQSMPLLHLHTISPTTRLAVWHITEPEAYFAEVAAHARPIAHPHKRLQHLCGRYLLRHLAPDFSLADLVAEQNNKPFLPGHPYHFSVSHTANLAAAMVSTTLQVGIDVEVYSRKMQDIRHKFLTAEEEMMLVQDTPLLTDIQRLTLAWSAKETLFKWLGQSGIDFKAHLRLQRIIVKGENGLIVAQLGKFRYTEVRVAYSLAEEWVLSWLATGYTSE
jgi:phosphopantetheinyl transferase